MLPDNKLVKGSHFRESDSGQNDNSKTSDYNAFNHIIKLCAEQEKAAYSMSSSLFKVKRRNMYMLQIGCHTKIKNEGVCEYSISATSKDGQTTAKITGCCLEHVCQSAAHLSECNVASQRKRALKHTYTEGSSDYLNCFHPSKNSSARRSNVCV